MQVMEDALPPWAELPDLDPIIGYEPYEDGLQMVDFIRDPRLKGNKRQTTPVEELHAISVNPTHPEMEVLNGSELPEPLRSEMIAFLMANLDVFAWSQEDMTGIDPAVVCHRLNINPEMKLTTKESKVCPQKI